MEDVVALPDAEERVESPNRITTSLLAFVCRVARFVFDPDCLVKYCSLFASRFEKGEINCLLEVLPVSLLSTIMLVCLKLELDVRAKSALSFSSNIFVFPLGSPETVRQTADPVRL